MNMKNLIERKSIDIITDLVGSTAANSSTNCRVVEDHIKEIVNSNMDYPAGAIENGREFLRRLGEYDCEAGAISMSTDYMEAVCCFEYLAAACATLVGRSQ